MKLFLIIIFIIFIILAFFLINLYLKKNFNEFFEKTESGLVCGKQNDICSTYSSTGKNSCCAGYDCVLPNGNYQYKICSNSIIPKIDNIIPDITEIELPKLKMPKLKMPTFKNMFSFENSICGK